MTMRTLVAFMLSAGLSMAAFAEEPSAEAEQAAKTAKQSAGEFDPQTYTCGHFMGDLEKEGSELMGVALIWMHGYQSAAHGTDAIGALNEAAVSAIAQEVAEYCTEASGETFSRVAHQIASEE
ncbi:HdeA/HdeB family chaperone [Thioflexithrix psekupsensis]|uniref:Rap1a immunity protein domain-containing protein n=1 Tax=Thioflexithrix psekupsensis TaxID=1570016 RepID=A0A251X5X0_9GAMM|nr:HdeA/HdeB family chaperone [Thioflexithrix psekupsensis]OUD12498.1 hypothetical protein TPSD3_15490 [Thioflexithrix psekupsensis]